MFTHIDPNIIDWFTKFRLIKKKEIKVKKIKELLYTCIEIIRNVNNKKIKR